MPNKAERVIQNESEIKWVVTKLPVAGRAEMAESAIPRKPRKFNSIDRRETAKPVPKLKKKSA